MITRCAWCKTIMYDEGDDTAYESHGMCAGCAVANMPDEDEDEILEGNRGNDIVDLGDDLDDDDFDQNYEGCDCEQCINDALGDATGVR